jgi:hypothetical protein
MSQWKRDGAGLPGLPFALRDGRMFAPWEVSNGDACGCVCPACNEAVRAKHGKGKRRPHFAHAASGSCNGFESAIHLRAKQLIIEYLCLNLPAWDGQYGLINPPTYRAESGGLLRGEKLVFPGGKVTLTDAKAEPPMQRIRPDVSAQDEDGELLIEIRVSHAVDVDKAALVRASGHRMIEIDLSGFHVGGFFDHEAFEHEVLHSEANKRWISYPAAVAALARAQAALEANAVLAVENVQEDRPAGHRESPEVVASVRWPEIPQLPRAESEDRTRYPRVGQTTWQVGLGCGFVLSRAVRHRAVYRVQFECGVRYILFREDEPW